MVTLASIKATLAELGVPAEVVDRAAAEMQRENLGPFTLVFSLMVALAFWACVSLPGLLCIALAIPLGGFWAWALYWAGGLWLLFMLAPLIDTLGDELRLMRKRRGDA
jgi:hypothetical protein